MEACWCRRSVALPAAFAFWELYGTKAPAVALRVLKERGAWTVSLTYFFIGVSLYGLSLAGPPLRILRCA